MIEISIPDIALQNNTNERVPCVLVLDGSGSMAGAPIEQLNAGMRLLEDELKKDDLASQRVQVLVIRFGGENQVEVLSDWKDAMDFDAPVVKANGLTPMGDAMRVALGRIEEQKARYKANGIAYKRPWLWLITDGEPTDKDWQNAAAECCAAQQNGKVVIFGIGTGDANLEKLAQFSTSKPLRLEGLKFQELFQWITKSTKIATVAAPNANVQMPSPSDWMQAPT